MEITVVTLVEEQMSPWKGVISIGNVEGDGKLGCMIGVCELVAKLTDKVVMEVLVRCWSDGDVVVRSCDIGEADEAAVDRDVEDGIDAGIDIEVDVGVDVEDE
ncbi:hypothetical protein Tco_0455897 [Tanacetum coccineum]